MNILCIKHLVAEKEYYCAQGKNKSDGIAKYSNGNRSKFFKASFCMSINIFRNGVVKLSRKIKAEMLKIEMQF